MICLSTANVNLFAHDAILVTNTIHASWILFKNRMDNSWKVSLITII